ncbi:MAG: hypothetical protein H6822_02335 [Planctomycetaceae bacterium]|nr:hypothetical protein [Planctomycetaceae bacterium]
MKYRTAGLLSLGLTAVATLTFYNIASTRAQPPLGSASRNSDNHNHDHDHDGHNHSHQDASESPAPNADAITAPFGGPPPLPTTRPAPSTNQSGALQQGLRSPPAADSPPTLLPPSSAPAYTFQPGSYDCPNARQYDNHSHRDVCPLDFANQTRLIEGCDQQCTTPYATPNAFHQPTPYRFDSSREYELLNYPAFRGRADPCYEQFGHDFHGDGPTYHEHQFGS